MNAEPITYATLPEVMIYQVARTIQDGELVFHGYGSPVPTLAMLLAKRTHASHMVHIEGATYGINPEPPFLPPTSNDWSLEQGSVMAIGISDLFDIAARGDMGRMFLSGVQIDRYGNLNVTPLAIQIPHESSYLAAAVVVTFLVMSSTLPSGLQDIALPQIRLVNASFVS